MLDEKTAKRIQTIVPMLDENQKRMYLAAEAESLGRGGISLISQALGVSRNTIAAGILEALEGLVAESSYGDPQSPLRWTTKNLRNLSDLGGERALRFPSRRSGRCSTTSATACS